MNAVFADTAYWLARFDPDDQWHTAARDAAERVGGARVFTTQEVFVETFNMLSKRDRIIRSRMLRIVNGLTSDPDVVVLAESEGSFRAGLALYAKRLDKRYSLTDCISMTAMKANKIEVVLTSDHHFEQEGFTILMKR
jgi:predicted nucleic acid-binding protein